jgi:hypothetical protein
MPSPRVESSASIIESLRVRGSARSLLPPEQRPPMLRALVVRGEPCEAKEIRRIHPARRFTRAVASKSLQEELVRRLHRAGCLEAVQGGEVEVWRTGREISSARAQMNRRFREQPISRLPACRLFGIFPVDLSCLTGSTPCVGQHSLSLEFVRLFFWAAEFLSSTKQHRIRLRWNRSAGCVAGDVMVVWHFETASLVTYDSDRSGQRQG